MKTNKKLISIGEQIGSNLKLARIRRNITQDNLATQSGISRPTLSNLESGDIGVSMGVLISVMINLGLEKEIARLALSDTQGRLMQDENLNKRARTK